MTERVDPRSGTRRRFDEAASAGATSCPHPVRWAAMTQRWDRLTFVHWEFEPADIGRLLPDPLRVHTFDGAAWVGLIPFDMRNVRLSGLPQLPGANHFFETNVRTYVTGPDGTPGVYFFSLDAASAPVVAFARASYQLPYMWSQMAMRATGDGVQYACRRRVPGPRGAESDLTVALGPTVEPDALDVFLTARWGLFQVGRRGTVRYTPVEHDPWPLQSAEIVQLADELVAAAGVPEPEGRMRVRYSPGVDVRIGFPRRVRS